LLSGCGGDRVPGREEKIVNVEQILKVKGANVATVPVTATVEAAAQKLAQKKIGAVIVVRADGGMAGIISERDIIRGIGQEGANILGQPVSKLMTREVITCAPTDTVDNLMEVMTARRFRHLPVLDRGRLAGIVSIGDVVKYQIAEVTQEAALMREYITHG
jgi:CBS domain-containing protein